MYSRTGLSALGTPTFAAGTLPAVAAVVGDRRSPTRAAGDRRRPADVGDRRPRRRRRRRGRVGASTTSRRRTRPGRRTSEHHDEHDEPPRGDDPTAAVLLRRSAARRAPRGRAISDATWRPARRASSSVAGGRGSEDGGTAIEITAMLRLRASPVPSRSQSSALMFSTIPNGHSVHARAGGVPSGRHDTLLGGEPICARASASARSRSSQAWPSRPRRAAATRRNRQHATTTRRRARPRRPRAEHHGRRQPPARRRPAAASTARKVLACEVTDTGGADDKGFNQNAYEGITDAEKEFGIKGELLESKTDADYAPNINAFIGKKCSVIVTVGFLLGSATADCGQGQPGPAVRHRRLRRQRRQRHAGRLDRRQEPAERAGAELRHRAAVVPRRLPRRGHEQDAAPSPPTAASRSRR